jgi:inorganic triphosphatase YgiF
MSATAAPVETELKLRLPAASVPALWRHPVIRQLARGEVVKQTLVATYFDTDDRRLQRAHLALRVRREGREWIQTVKGEATDERGAMSARPEVEWPLGNSRRRPPPDTARFASTPWRRALEKAADRGLLPIFTTAIVRRSLALELSETTRATLSVDAGEIRAGGHVLEVSEVEIELEAGSTEPVYRIAQTLAADLPLSLETASKAARGYALVAPVAREPTRAENPQLRAARSACDALATILRECTHQVECNADGLVADDDPEFVHQMRIGTRRMRACLALLRDLTPASLLGPLAADARWLARSLGPARDLDVLATETLAEASAALSTIGESEHRAAWRTFLARVARRRVEARAAARAAVTSPRFVQLVLAAGALAATPYLGAVPGSRAGLELAKPVADFARPLLKRRHRKLLRRGEHLVEATPEARHATRIASKRVRYVAEFFSDVFAKKRVRAYRNALSKMQDVLGTQNDAAVAARLAVEIAGPGFAAATLSGWSAAKASAHAGELARAWNAFARCTPFWDRR